VGRLLQSARTAVEPSMIIAVPSGARLKVLLPTVKAWPWARVLEPMIKFEEGAWETIILPIVVNGTIGSTELLGGSPCSVGGTFSVTGVEAD
jgi:hypothetical protein